MVSGVHLETRDDFSSFGTVIKVDGDAIPERLERPLKAVDRAEARRAGAIAIPTRTLAHQAKVMRALRLARNLHVGGMAFTVLDVDEAHELLYEDRVRPTGRDEHRPQRREHYLR